MEDRIIELEIRLTQQQDTISELSEVLFQQQKELGLLHREVEALKQKLQAEPGLVDANQKERPPHY
jgi:SlyX protein